MQKVTTEQIKQALLEKFGDKLKVQSIEEIPGAQLMYRIVSQNGEALVTKRIVWSLVHDKPILRIGKTFEFKGVEYTQHGNKEETETLLLACGFKKPKLEQAEIPLWKKIQSSLHAPKNMSDQQAKYEAKHYNTFVDYTKNVCDNFRYVSITYTDTQLSWKYYTGTGKEFTEGKAKKIIDPLEIEFLIPLLEEVLIKYGHKINNLCKIPLQQMEAA